MFRRLSYIFATQFTAFVFLLLLVAGSVFLGVDYFSLRAVTSHQLQQESNRIVGHLGGSLTGDGDQLPPNSMNQRDLTFTRLLNPNQSLRYAGPFFIVGDVPVVISSETAPVFSEVTVDAQEYRIITQPIRLNGQLAGYLQVADRELITSQEVAQKALQFLGVSALISLLTFMVGLAFARRNLKPVQESVERLEQFTQDASHELKTPLTVLSSSLDLALQNKQYREGILSAKQDVAQVTQLVERLLELARLNRTKLRAETFDLSELVRELGARYQVAATEADVSLETNVQSGVQVWGDATLLRQMLVNLIGNALKFTPAKGTIQLILTRTSLKVMDSGSGISHEHLAHIFDRFYQADPSRAHEGFGLGLAFVKQVAELHRWKVEVQSEVGKGTSFTLVFLPHRAPLRRS